MHVRINKGVHDIPLLDGGWVRNPNIDIGLPLIDRPRLTISRTGPTELPLMYERVVFEPIHGSSVTHRWCRLEAYKSACRRSINWFETSRNHLPMMKLFQALLSWIEKGRPQDQVSMAMISHYASSAIELGANHALVERIVRYYTNGSIDSQQFYKISSLVPLHR